MKFFIFKNYPDIDSGKVFTNYIVAKNRAKAIAIYEDDFGKNKFPVIREVFLGRGHIGKKLHGYLSDTIQSKGII